MKAAIMILYTHSNFLICFPSRGLKKELSAAQLSNLGNIQFIVLKNYYTAPCTLIDLEKQITEQSRFSKFVPQVLLDTPIICTDYPNQFSNINWLCAV